MKKRKLKNLDTANLAGRKAKMEFHYLVNIRKTPLL